MDSEVEYEDDPDFEADLEAWLRKQAAEDGVDFEDPYAGELEAIQRFQQNPNMEDFEWLHNQHRPLINWASSRYTGSTTLPKAAVRGFALQRYTHALQTYDPNRGAQFKTHLGNEMRRVGRYLQKYQNVGRVSESRAGMIDLLQTSDVSLRESLGRAPTDVELADEMLLAAQDVADLQKKMKNITPKNVGTLRKELRVDLTAEEAGGQVENEGDSRIRRQAVFLHGSLNPEQQLVLEHTFEGFGKPVIEDDSALAAKLEMSPQKVRALKGQIRKKVERFW